MSIKIVSQKNIPVTHLPGRDLQWIVNSETIGTEDLSIAIMNCPGESVVRPMHSHKDIEEIILILEGEGQAWVDGEVGFFKKGDAVLFPKSSKHQVRNTGKTPLRTASIFSGQTNADSYTSYEQDAFEIL